MESNNHILNEDLYKYIPPPIPLIPKNKYIDDTPVTHQALIKNFQQPSTYCTVKEHIDQPIGRPTVNPFVVIPTMTMTSVNENK